MVGPGIEWSKQVMPAVGALTSAAVPKPAAVLKPGKGIDSLLAGLPFLSSRGASELTGACHSTASMHCSSNARWTAAALLRHILAALQLLSQTAAALFDQAKGALHHCARDAQHVCRSIECCSTTYIKLSGPNLHAMRCCSKLSQVVPLTLLPPSCIHCTALHCRLCAA
jgi:hypothetical protein